jgi:hypothetical protein
MITPDTTIYDYALELAIKRGWSFKESDSVGHGLIWIDSRRQIVAVHPGASLVTLRMNTQGASIFQNYPAKP